MDQVNQDSQDLKSQQGVMCSQLSELMKVVDTNFKQVLAQKQ
jgi:hypothetical protein